MDPDMFDLVIRCPLTGKDLRTCVMLTGQDFINIEIEHFQSICNHCYRVHTWSKADASLQINNDLDLPPHINLKD